MDLIKVKCLEPAFVYGTQSVVYGQVFDMQRVDFFHLKKTFKFELATTETKLEEKKEVKADVGGK